MYTSDHTVVVRVQTKLVLPVSTVKFVETSWELVQCKCSYLHTWSNDEYL